MQSAERAHQPQRAGPHQGAGHRREQQHLEQQRPARLRQRRIGGPGRQHHMHDPAGGGDLRAAFEVIGLAPLGVRLPALHRLKHARRVGMDDVDRRLAAGVDDVVALAAQARRRQVAQHVRPMQVQAATEHAQHAAVGVLDRHRHQHRRLAAGARVQRLRDRGDPGVAGPPEVVAVSHADLLGDRRRLGQEDVARDIDQGDAVEHRAQAALGEERRAPPGIGEGRGIAAPRFSRQRRQVHRELVVEVRGSGVREALVAAGRAVPCTPSTTAGTARPRWRRPGSAPARSSTARPGWAGSGACASSRRVPGDRRQGRDTGREKR